MKTDATDATDADNGFDSTSCATSCEQNFIWLLRGIGLIGLSPKEMENCVAQYTLQFGYMMRATGENHYNAMELMMEFILMGQLKFEIRNDVVQLWVGSAINREFVFVVKTTNLEAINLFAELAVANRWMRERISPFRSPSNRMYVPEETMRTLTTDSTWRTLMMDTFREFLRFTVIKNPCCSISMLDSVLVACSALEMKMESQLHSVHSTRLLTDMKEMAQTNSLF